MSLREIGVKIGTRNDYVYIFSNAEQSIPAPRILPFEEKLHYESTNSGKITHHYWLKDMCRYAK